MQHTPHFYCMQQDTDICRIGMVCFKRVACFSQIVNYLLLKGALNGGATGSCTSGPNQVYYPYTEVNLTAGTHAGGSVAIIV